MNTSSNAFILTNRDFFRQREYAALCRIPGIGEIMGAYADQRPALEKQYPDAAFALKIVSNLFFHDRELTAIHMNAYTAILNGDNLAEARFRYDRELEEYHLRHNWD